MGNMPIVRAVTLVRGRTDIIDDKRRMVNDFVCSKDWAIIKEFIFENVSWIELYSRDELKEIIWMAENGDIDVVVVYSLNCLGYDVIRAFDLINQLDSNRINVWDATNNSVITDQKGGIDNLINHHFASKIKLRIAKTKLFHIEEE